MLSNPIELFVTGNNLEGFTYEGGSKLFHFSSHDNGLTKNMEVNVIFMADDLGHAENVLARMFAFVVAKSLQYAAYKDQHDPKDRNLFALQARAKANQYSGWLIALAEKNITIKEAPTGQFYKVGWACNDTI